MKKRAGFFAAFLLLLFPFFLQAQKVKTVDGVKIISYSKKPKPAKGIPGRLILTEELRFGESENLDKSFAEVTAFAVDADGNVYAVDMKDSKVKVFDKEGGYLRSIGKKGQGPGELEMPSGIQIIPGPKLVVEDALARRLAYFQLDGTFIKNVSFADRLAMVNIIFDKAGNVLAREMGIEGNELFFGINKYDPDLKSLFTLDKIKFAIPTGGNKMNIMDLMAIYQMDMEGNIYYTRNLDYEIKIYSPSGKHTESLTKDYDPEKVTEEDIQEMLARIPQTSSINYEEILEFPKEFPPIQYFFLDDLEHLFVKTWERAGEKDRFYVDVFDVEGRFLTRFATKADLRLVRGKKLYSIEENEDGFKVIVRYGMAWK
ncbi:MAG: 6-bladed beta-propeller [Candidatus Aminicenantes bacterium]|nr:6-bladed beta-propeller [Candidatus Aminicenantes bacterium]